MKKNTTGLIIGLLVGLILGAALSTNIPAMANQAIKILYNGQQIQSDVDPIIVNGRVMVPIRVIANIFNANIAWDSQNNNVIITNDLDTGSSAAVSGLSGPSSVTVSKDDITVHIKGNITNNTKATYSRVSVQYNLYDYDGKQIGSATDSTTNLLPGTTWKFDAMGIANNYSTYKLVKVSAN